MKNDELLELKQQQIEKYNILTTLHEEINIIQTEHKHHEKLREKHSRLHGNKSAGENDLKRLVDISSHQQQHIKRIVDDIRELRLKSNATCLADSPLLEEF